MTKIISEQVLVSNVIAGSGMPFYLALSFVVILVGMHCNNLRVCNRVRTKSMVATELIEKSERLALNFLVDPGYRTAIRLCAGMVCEGTADFSNEPVIIYHK